jgi:hypothetical protein
MALVTNYGTFTNPVPDLPGKGGAELKLGLKPYPGSDLKRCVGKHISFFQEQHNVQHNFTQTKRKLNM